jgi:hypothetical protein
VLGIIGIFLPLMPSTIFFILAAWCFARSSEKFYNKLINHPRIGKFIRDYRDERGMPFRSKVIAITMLMVTIGSSALFFTEQLLVKLLLFIIAISVTIYILSLKTVSEKVPGKSE